MNDRIFIDTNILIYAFLENEKEKHDKALELLSRSRGKEVFVSTQVLSEIYAGLSKNGIEHNAIEKYLLEIDESMNIHIIDFETIKRCLALKKRYNYSYWDSLILASSIESGCSILYSEDLQDGQIIEKTLTLRDPMA